MNMKNLKIFKKYEKFRIHAEKITHYDYFLSSLILLISFGSVKLVIDIFRILKMYN
jgi:hypothetical protein